MEIVPALLLPFGLAAWLRLRGWPASRAIALACLLAPVIVTFEAFVFPADPEFRKWWQSTVLSSVFFGFVAAAGGYWLAVIVKRSDVRKD